MARLTPVDYDPFAPPQGVRLVPVEGDPFATPAAPPPVPGRSMGAEAVRQPGLGVRHAIEGAAQTAGIVYDPIAVIGNKLLPGDPFMSASSLGRLTADGLGLPSPENGYERVTGGVLRGATGAGGFVGLGKLAGGAAGAALAAKPGAQLIAGATGGGAADTAREAGLPVWAQVGAGVAGALAPAGVAGGLRALTRGVGEPARKSVLDTIDQFARSGAGVPTVGQATQGRGARGLEALLGRVPGSAGRMEATGAAQQAGMGARVGAVADSLSTKASPEQAGRAIERGITGPGGFMQSFRQVSNQLYAAVDNFIPGNTPISVTRTKATLDQLASPTPGAVQTSRALMSGKVSELRGALDADLQASIAAAGRGQLPYEAVKGLRTRLGELIADSSLNPDMPTKQLKAVYAALSDDLGAAVAATGNPQAVQAAQRANTYFRAAMARLDDVERVVQRNGGPEKVFAAATSGTREGATTLRAVMQSLPEEGQKTLAAAVLRRLGKANPSAQDDVGEVFSSESFLSNWNKLSEDAKRAVFDRFGPGFSRDLDTLAATAANMREGAQVFRNPPGTAQATNQIITAGSFALSVITGNVQVAGAIGTGVVAANVGARAMTSPRVVRWLAEATKVPVAALPMQVTRLKAEAQAAGDEDALAVARALEEQAGNQQVGR